jgi:signal transduction histidine kinase
MDAMSGGDALASGPIRLRLYILGLTGLWTAAVALVLAWDMHDEWDQVVGIAQGEARGVFENDVLFRRWSSIHGGVYVPVTEKTQPSPYLAKMPERDVVTPSGRRLTLVNPAYMTRQVHELAQEQFGIRGHITSLQPIRPENAPDDWEREALGRFREGQAEVSSLEDIAGQLHLRLMRPMVTEADCLKCHGSQGYQVGDVRGGISVSVPVGPLWTARKADIAHRLLGYAGLWLVGLSGIFLAGRRLRGQIERRYRAERALFAAHHDLEDRVAQRTADLTEANASLAAEIAGRKRMEEDARAAQQRLLAMEHREKERAEAELEKVRAQLVRQTRLATIGQLSASIAHELRNPLGVIRNAVFLLKRKVPKAEEKCYEYLGIIDDETATANQIITELMAMTRGEAPTKEPVELCKLVTDALARMTIPDTVHWQRECNPNPFVVHADPAQLTQVIRNLFLNAVQAMSGSGTVTVRTNRTDSFDEITIADTGPGIPPHVRQEIFEPLFTTKSKGTGLGLSVCRQIIERHGGSLDVLDSQGGAVFHIRLPRQESVPSPAPREVQAEGCTR